MVSRPRGQGLGAAARRGGRRAGAAAARALRPGGAGSPAHRAPRGRRPAGARQGGRHGGPPGARLAVGDGGQRAAPPARRGGHRGGERLGLVHRLDKETSRLPGGGQAGGVAGGAAGRLQGPHRGEDLPGAGATARRPTEGRLDTPYGRHPRDRTRYTGRVAGGRGGPSPPGGCGSASARRRRCWRSALETGRTHQIRVHLSEAGHPLLADAVYGGRGARRGCPRRSGPAGGRGLGRQALHAWRLALAHPRTGKPLRFEAPLPPDLRALAILRKALPR